MPGSTFIRLFQDIYCIPCKTKTRHTHIHTKSKPFFSASNFYTTKDAFYDCFGPSCIKKKKYKVQHYAQIVIKKKGVVNVSKDVYQVHKQLFCTQGGHISCTLYISVMPCLLHFIHSNSVLRFKFIQCTSLTPVA